MDEFEKLLCECNNALARFVNFKISNRFDAEDIFQEICLTANQKFGSLRDKSLFKAWIISIARNKCNDYYRLKAKAFDIPLDEITENSFSYSRYGIIQNNVVSDTLDKLGSKDKQILYLYFFREMRQEDIAKQLCIPIGTVKSRLHTAKANFKEKYPCQPITKGENNMKTLPKIMPEYKITKLDQEPFAVKWEELMGWFIVPKLGEKLSWGMYDMPNREIRNSYDITVPNKAIVHGIRGVKIDIKRNLFKSTPDRILDMYFIAQLTDTHSRFLAESHYSKDRDSWMYFTFLDGAEVFEDIGSFMDNWGYGEDNCGNETNLKVKGDITRDGNLITTKDKNFLLDVVGRYQVAIAGKTYDTICVIDIETYNSGVMSEQYIDQNGKTVLWRRFNCDDWKFDFYKEKWSDKLPNNEKITVNGKTYVHWYDCITDYIL